MSFFQNHSNWPLAPLKDIATLKRGYDLPVSQRVEGDISIYAANGINGSHNRSKIQGPGVITGRSGTIGKVHYSEKDFWPLNTSLYVMDFHGNDSRWVFYLLKAFRLERFSEGAGVPTLNRNLVHDELIPLPPLQEQKRIAAILDKADAIRRKRQQTIQLADEFLRAVFLDMFGDPVSNPKGWDVKRLADLSIGKFQNGAYFPKEEYCDDGVEMVHMADAFYDIIMRGSLKRVNANEKEIEKYGLSSNDIMISRRSLNYEGAAKPSLIPDSEEPLIFESSMIRFTPDKKIINKQYLFQYLSNSIVKDHYIRKYVTGATIKGISQKNLEEVKVLVPPLKKQLAFEKIVSQIFISRDKFNSNVDDISNLFGSLGQAAFKGGL